MDVWGRVVYVFVPASSLICDLSILTRAPSPLPVTFSLPAASETILVLSQSDDRFYGALSGASDWSIDFKLFKRGEDEALGSMTFSYAVRRSGTLRMDLEEGEYVVHVRLGRRVAGEKVSNFGI